MTLRARARGASIVVLYGLTVVALIDTASELVRFAVDADDRFGWARLAVGVSFSVGCSAWAYRRWRGRQRSATLAADDGAVALQSPVAVWAERPAWRRWLPRVVAVVALAAIGFTIADQSSTLRAAVSDLRHLDWRLVRLAVYLEAGSMLAYALLFYALVRGGSRRVRLGWLVWLTLAGNAVMGSLPGGVAWSATFSIRALWRRGAPFAVAVAVPVASSIVALLALVALALVGVDLAGASGPAAPFRVAVTAGTAGAVVVIAALVVWLRRHAGLRSAARTWAAMRLTPKALASAFVAGTANWLLDCGCLVASFLAVSGHVPWQGVLVAYCAGQLASNLPITPGGIGVVEGTMTLLLVAYGMHTPVALAGILLYRLISFWLLLPIGWAAVAGILLGERRAGVALAPATRRAAEVAPAPRPIEPAVG